jgi:hypothetical protein
MPNLKKNVNKKFYCFDQKWQITSPLASNVTGEVFIAQKRTSSASKREISSFFRVFFILTGSSQAKRMRIFADPDPQH